MSFTRRTKIVCTIGPASRSPDQIARLIKAGMDVARLNFSHGTYEQHMQTIAIIRQQSDEAGKPIAILQDLQGPKIRTGELRDHQPITLTTGSTITITTRPIIGDATAINTTYLDLPNDVQINNRILLSDGLIELRVLSVSPPDIQCQVINGGRLAEHQGINLPGVAVSAPALTAKDRADLIFGVNQGVDFIALSFVRRPSDLEMARQAIAEAQQHANPAMPPIPLIAKIEKPEALNDLDAILRAADGVMVARGDLGVEMPLEQVPLIQKRIIRRANELEVLVITATQMLESMITNPRPTRAEVSDVANAIMDGTDAIMLSGETAAGKYPIEAAQVMASIACETEEHANIHRIETSLAKISQAVSHAGRVLADQAQARYIVVFTHSGLSAHLISKDRPSVPILALVRDEHICRQLALWWGVTPICSELAASTEERIINADRLLQEQGWVEMGDTIVILGAMPIHDHAKTNFVKLHEVGTF